MGLIPKWVTDANDYLVQEREKHLKGTWLGNTLTDLPAPAGVEVGVEALAHKEVRDFAAANPALALDALRQPDLTSQIIRDPEKRAFLAANHDIAIEALQNKEMTDLVLADDKLTSTVLKKPELAREAFKDKEFAMKVLKDPEKRAFVVDHPDIAIDALKNKEMSELVLADKKLTDTIIKHPELAREAFKDKEFAMKVLKDPKKSAFVADHPDIAIEALKNKEMTKVVLANENLTNLAMAYPDMAKLVMKNPAMLKTLTENPKFVAALVENPVITSALSTVAQSNPEMAAWALSTAAPLVEAGMPLATALSSAAGALSPDKAVDTLKQAPATLLNIAGSLFEAATPDDAATSKSFKLALPVVSEGAPLAGQITGSQPTLATAAGAVIQTVSALALTALDSMKFVVQQVSSGLAAAAQSIGGVQNGPGNER